MSHLICLADQLGHGRARGVQGKAPLKGCASQGDLNERYFDKLVAPLLPHVRYDQLIFVPHGVLHYVPFAALSDGSRRLLETKTVSYAPSASILRFLSDRASPFDGEVLVLGDPTTKDLEELRWAREEAQTVASLFNTKPWLGDEATEGRLRDAAGRIDLLHLAAHGVPHPQTPRLTRIALAGDESHDGSLEVEEVFDDLDLRGVNLVVLSACQTALGEHTEGDEIIGLTRAFLDAGSPTVVSTLWRVNDRATAFLMRAFYQRLLSGASYAEALRAAQLETSRQAGWGDPYYWAAFTLTGDPEGNWAGEAKQRRESRRQEDERE